LGGVESESASYDEPYAVVEAFDASVVVTECNGGEAACAVLSDGAPGCDEGFESAALSA
jgi:hypothetical protein